jgi:cell division septum initiation protein DivIVA
MSSILEHIRKNNQDAQRLIGLEHEQLERLLENAKKLHNEKQALLESKKVKSCHLSVSPWQSFT